MICVSFIGVDFKFITSAEPSIVSFSGFTTMFTSGITGMRFERDFDLPLGGKLAALIVVSAT